tara:strand:- start:1344 stop:1508 length:165 start_codon:yes stop_codon:yes gene_type:complete
MECGYFDLASMIRKSLTDQCEGCCLDDKEDFETVMGVVEEVVEEWLEARCSGCQ